MSFRTPTLPAKVQVFLDTWWVLVPATFAGIYLFCQALFPCPTGVGGWEFSTPYSTLRLSPCSQNGNGGAIHPSSLHSCHAPTSWLHDNTCRSGPPPALPRFKSFRTRGESLSQLHLLASIFFVRPFFPAWPHALCIFPLTSPAHGLRASHLLHFNLSVSDPETKYNSDDLSAKSQPQAVDHWDSGRFHEALVTRWRGRSFRPRPLVTTHRSLGLSNEAVIGRTGSCWVSSRWFRAMAMKAGPAFLVGPPLRRSRQHYPSTGPKRQAPGWAILPGRKT